MFELFFLSFSLDLFCWWISDGKCWNSVWTVNFKYDCVSDIFWVYLIQLAQNIWIFSVVFFLCFEISEMLLNEHWTLRNSYMDHGMLISTYTHAHLAICWILCFILQFWNLSYGFESIKNNYHCRYLGNVIAMLVNFKWDQLNKCSFCISLLCIT